MPDRYVMPGQLFASLALGGGGQSAARWLARAERAKHMLLLRGVLDSAAATTHPELSHVRYAYQTLADIHQRSAKAVETILMQPAVAAWAVDTIHRLHNEGEVPLAGQVSAIAAAAAIRARATFTGMLTLDDGSVMIPTLGRALLPGARAGSEAEILVTPVTAEIRAAGHRVRLPSDPLHDGEGWQSLKRITVSAGRRQWRITIDDLDPYRFAAFPGLAGHLTVAELDEWRARLQEAFVILTAHHLQVAEELLEMINVLTPLVARSGAQANATSRETFGCIALSFPGDGESMALALAHEIQHTKLAALLDLFDFFQPTASDTLYYAPWRDDPRPLPALMHGTYAFLGVARFWQQERTVQTDDRVLTAHVEFARWRSASTETALIMRQSPDLTTLGRRFLEGMLDTMRAWQDEPVPTVAEELARTAAEHHRGRWLEIHGMLRLAAGRSPPPVAGRNAHLPHMSDPGRGQRQEQRMPPSA